MVTVKVDSWVMHYVCKRRYAKIETCVCVFPFLQDASVSCWNCGAPGLPVVVFFHDVTTKRGGLHVGLRRAALTPELLLVLQPR